VTFPTCFSRLESLIRTQARVTPADAEIRQLEADNIRAALKAAGGKVSGTEGEAQLLGMKPTTLASRIKSLGNVPAKHP
jgi:transcriptional regulator with GAF, ATPase, and Fis domain